MKMMRLHLEGPMRLQAEAHQVTFAEGINPAILCRLDNLKSKASLHLTGS